MNIRPATFEDTKSMMMVKKNLVFQEMETSSTEGGFLLGTDVDGYRARIAQNCTWVLEEDGGFAHAAQS